MKAWIDLDQYKAAQDLEQALGSPYEPRNLFSYADALSLDEASLFPGQQAEVLNSLRVNHYFVPLEWGGKLASFESCMAIFRSVFRRDVTLGLGYGVTSFMAALPVFLYGSEDLKKRASALLLSGQTLSLAYYEGDHGNDVLGNQLEAVLQETGQYALNGRKCIVNNLISSPALVVFAKTASIGGGRGFSLFFVDQKDFPSSSVSRGPKIKTQGVRGCKISGIQFHQAPVSANCIVGLPGEGFEMTFKAFQISRAILPGMSLGACDTALRMVMKHVQKRKLYGAPMLHLPHVSETLSQSFIQLLICDVLSICVARSLQVIPEQMSVISAISKFYIPKMMQGMLKHLGVVLGARHYLREEESAFFQKILRDYPVVSLGHSSDVICAATLLSQMKALLKSRGQSSQIGCILDCIFNLSTPLPPFEMPDLKMSNHGCNDIMQSIDFLSDRLREKMDAENTSLLVQGSIHKSVHTLKRILAQLENTVDSLGVGVAHFSQESYDFAQSYCNVFVGLCCIWFWISNQWNQYDFFLEASWLALSLQEIFKNPCPFVHEAYQPLTDTVLSQLEHLFLTQYSFSILPIYYP